MRVIRVRSMVVATTVLMAAVACGVFGRVVYATLINGPDLAGTPAELSLAPVFPPVTGWSADTIEAARAYADEQATFAAVFLYDGQLAAEWGRTDVRTDVHSVRKSLVNALYGIAVDRGLIDVTSTLASLQVDDRNPSLNDLEKSATIEQLLQSRSGIYHPSVRSDGEPPPARGTHRPGEAFFYNNWGFNALGGIFERATGLRLGDAFLEWIAAPLGMQDFRPEDVHVEEGHESVFAAYRFRMSTRDLARFGELYAHYGEWNGRQIVPRAWIERTMTRISDVGNGVGYGYLWWLMPDSTWMATGTGGQKIIIDPGRKLVTITKVDTGEGGMRRAIWWGFGKRLDNTIVREMRRRIAAAARTGTFAGAR